MTITKARPQPSTPAPLFAGQSSDLPGNPDDFVECLLALLRRRLPALTAELAGELGAELRDQWGGDRPYIARRAGEGRSGRNESIRRDYQRGERLALLERRYNISQRHILRIIKSE